MQIVAEKIQVNTTPVDLSAVTGCLLIVPLYATGDIPAASTTIEGAIVYDSTTNKLKVCVGGSWEAITSA